MYIKVIEHYNSSHYNVFKKFCNKEQEEIWSLYHKANGCYNFCFQLPIVNQLEHNDLINPCLYSDLNEALISIINELNEIPKHSEYLIPIDATSNNGVVYPKFRNLHLYKVKFISDDKDIENKNNMFCWVKKFHSTKKNDWNEVDRTITKYEPFAYDINLKYNKDWKSETIKYFDNCKNEKQKYDEILEICYVELIEKII